MGAFENQIRENETFDSLLELYGESLRANRELRKRLPTLAREIWEHANGKPGEHVEYTVEEALLRVNTPAL